MKTFISIAAFILLMSFYSKAQTGLIGNISTVVFTNNYTTEAYDTTFARSAYIELDDTVNISTVEIQLTNLNTNTELSSQSFVYSSISSAETTTAFSLARSGKQLRFYMGLLTFNQRYRITVKLKDQNSELSSQRIFEF